jgi:hypothetical protein
MAECEACAARYQELVQDLRAIGQVFRQEPPPRTVRDSRRRFTVRWLPRAVALAMALLLVWAGVRMWNQSAGLAVEGRANGESRSILDELPANPFLLTEALAVELAMEGAGSYDLAATVLEAERPCEWYDLPAPAERFMGDLEFSAGIPLASCVEIAPGQTERLENPQSSKKLLNHRMEVFQ